MAASSKKKPNIPANVEFQVSRHLVEESHGRHRGICCGRIVVETLSDACSAVIKQYTVGSYLYFGREERG